MRAAPDRRLLPSSPAANKLQTLNPATETVLTEVANCGPEEVDRAVEAATIAFYEGESSPPPRRRPQPPSRSPPQHHQAAGPAAPRMTAPACSPAQASGHRPVGTSAAGC